MAHLDPTRASEGQRKAIRTKAKVISVLVVEDELLIRMAMVDALRSAGYEVSEASDGDAAYEMLASESVDVLVTDIKMPGEIDGLALAKLVRGKCPSTKIVLVSANKYSDMASVADAVFFKPVSVAHMLNCVRDLIAPPTHAA